MTRYAFACCDVFTDTRFCGNPLAVLTDARGLSNVSMQAIAREFNFSETTFVLPPTEARNTARVRIFTPGGELPFAGHPTVGTAFVLAALGLLPTTIDSIVFEEGAGAVPVRIERSPDRANVARCVLTAPQSPRCVGTGPAADVIARAVGLGAGDINGTVEAWSCGVPFLVVPLASVAALERARIDAVAWRAAVEGIASEKIYPIACVDESTWRVRMFAPGVGIAEDPATGGAAAAVAGWLAQHDTRPPGVGRWTLLQGQEMGRPSRIDVEADVEDGNATNVRVGGASVLVSTGHLQI